MKEISTRKKIAIISPSLKMGGIERALTTLSIEFYKKGIEVHYISCLKANHFYSLDCNIKLHEPSFTRTNSKVNKLLFYPRLLLYLRTEVEKINPDKVLVFGDWFSPLSLLALLGTKYSVYISDRTIPNYPFKFPIPQLKKWLYPYSAGFIAQTKRSKEFKEEMFGKKLRIQIIANALTSFDQKNFFNREKSKKILYVGRFEWEKDPEILIRAFVHVNSFFPDWTLEMAGNGPLLEKMKVLVDSLNLKKSVIFHGKVNKIEELYSISSIFILPSVIEGFPNALIEAMSFGLPCICFSDIPFEDIVEPNVNGIVLKKRDSKHLSAAINFLIENKEESKRIGEMARDIKFKCAPEKISNEILNFMKI